MAGQRHGELQHVLAEESHPRRAVRLLQVPARRQRRAAIEDADVVEAEEASLEDMLAETVLAVHPPGEVQQQLVEGRLEEVQIQLAPQSVLGAQQEDRRKGVHWRVHVTEVPLIGRQLAVGVQVVPAQHQLHLLLGEIRVDDRERQGVEGQVPRRVPGVLPLVGHRDDVLVQHVKPLAVAELTTATLQGVGTMLRQPLVGVEEVVLLGPEHAGDSLAHHPRCLRGDCRRGHGTVELLGFTLPLRQGLLEPRPKGDDIGSSLSCAFGRL